MAWLEQRKEPGGGRGWYVVRRGPVGREVSARFGSKAAASAHRAQVERDQAARAKLGPMAPPLTIEQAVDRWVAHTSDGGSSERHCTDSRRKLLRLAQARDWNTVADITGATVGAIKIGERRLLLAMLRHLAGLGQPVDHHLLQQRLTARPPAVRPGLLTDDELAALLAKAAEWGPHGLALARFLATYGHRPESVAKLRVQDVDHPRRELTLIVKAPGGGRTFRHPLTADTLRELKALSRDRAPDAPLFLTGAGRGWTSGQRIAWWWYTRIGRPTVPRAPGVYELKRSAISRMLGDGMDPATVASITGHLTTGQVLRYARTNEDRQAAAVATLAKRALPGPSAAGQPTPKRTTNTRTMKDCPSKAQVKKS